MLVGIIVCLTFITTILWFIKNKFYKPYLDCQVPIEKIDSVLKEQGGKYAGETAVIIGGSFSGLTTAIIMSKYFRKVIIIDRSKIVPDESIAKSRQGEQAHVVGYRSMLIWDRLLPGFLDQMKECLKKNKLNQIVHPAMEARYIYKEGFGTSAHTDLRKNPMLMASRGQIETILRERVKKELKNVEFLDGYNVSSNGIKVETISENGEQITRVKSVTITSVSDTTSKTIECSLLVNCAGAGSSSLLKNIESAISPTKKLLTKSSIECKIGYQTIFIEPKDSSYDSEGKVAISREDRIDNVQENRKLNDPYYFVYHFSCYPNRRGVLFMPYSDNTFLILLTTYNEKIEAVQYETAKEQILEFTKFNPAMEKDTKIMLEKFKDVPKRIVPYYEKNGSEYIHYENLKGVRDFIAVGDAAGSLNPIYGQGITMAVDSIVMLDDMIKNELKKDKSIFNSNFCQEFQSRLSKSYLVPWLLCSSTDMRFDFAKYSPNLAMQKLISPIMGWMTDRLFMSSNVSAISSFYLLRVLLMEDGFRKELVNLYWLLGFVFRRETTILGVLLSISILISFFM